MTMQDHVDSYYAASANDPRRRPALAGGESADVCVVGGGFTGISAALNLAERGYKVVLLEANRIGWGASGRNGGQICTGYSCGMGKILKWAGREDAQRFFDMSEEAKDIIRQRIERHSIDCDPRWGYYHAAVKPSHLDDYRAYESLLKETFGYASETRFVGTKQESKAYAASDAYAGGLWEAEAGTLHPLNYCLGLARAAEGAGAILYEGSPVLRIEEGAKAKVVTAAGSVTADHVVVGCNAYLGRLLPGISGKIMPMGNYIGATAPLGEERAEALLPGRNAVTDSKFILNYYRIDGETRLLWGGLASYSRITPPGLAGQLKRDMLKTYPQLSDVDFTHVWGGWVGISFERAPHFGRIGKNLYFAQGYSGQGVALTGLAGKLIAEAVAGQAERFDLFGKLPHSSFPGGQLFRTPVLALAMTWFRLRDLLS